MQKLFFRNLAFLITVNLFIKPIWIFGIDRTVQNVVGAESYGLYFVLTNLSVITQILLDFGISNYNNRLIAQREDLLSNQLSNILSIKLLLTGFYLLITLFLAFVLHYSGYVLYLLLFICLNQALASLIVYVRSNISALHHFKVDSLFSIFDKGLMIIICGVLLYAPVFRKAFVIEWFIYAQSISYLITLAVALFYVLRISGKIPVSFSFPFTKNLLKKAFPFALLIALMLIYARVDALMIENLLPDDGQREAGLYASAFRLLDALNQFGFLFSVLLLPIFSRMISEGKAINELVKSSFTIIFILSVTAALSLSFYSLPIMHLLYHEANEYTAKILSILILTFIATSTIYIFSTLLTANNNLKQLTVIALLGVIMNLAFNFFLIRKFKALGAAETSVITNYFIAIAQIFLAKKIFGFKLNYGLLIRLTIFLLFAIATFYASTLIQINWLVSLLSAMALCTLTAFALGLLAIRKIKLLLS
ncbi:MAG: oligosaccharide flippase family protein [Chitinophagales bacterium]|nr:oligosaccharide flippase family protein [Chitinophagales bacterium]